MNEFINLLRESQKRVNLYTYAKENNLSYYELSNKIRYGRTFLDNKEKLRCEVRAFYRGDVIKKETLATIYVIGDDKEKDVSADRIYFNINDLIQK